MKKVIFSSLVFVLSMCLITGCKDNKNEVVEPNIDNEKLKFEISKLFAKKNGSFLIIEVTNLSKETINLSDYEIYLLDNQNNEIISFNENSILTPLSTIQIGGSFDGINLENSTSVGYRLLSTKNKFNIEYEIVDNLKLDISDIKYENNQSVVDLSLTNKGEEVIINSYKITFLDDDKKLKSIFMNNGNPNLSSNEKRILKLEVDNVDLTKTKKIKFEIIK